MRPEHRLSPEVVARIPVDKARLVAFCDRWHVARLDLFGSVVRDDFRPDSDVDVLVTFQPEANPGLLDHAAMEDELAELLGRPVDLLSRRAVERSANPIRRASILEGAIPLWLRQAFPEQWHEAQRRPISGGASVAQRRFATCLYST